MASKEPVYALKAVRVSKSSRRKSTNPAGAKGIIAPIQRTSLNALFSDTPVRDPNLGNSYVGLCLRGWHAATLQRLSSWYDPWSKGERLYLVECSGARDLSYNKAAFEFMRIVRRVDGRFFVRLEDRTRGYWVSTGWRHWQRPLTQKEIREAIVAKYPELRGKLFLMGGRGSSRHVVRLPY